MQKANCVLRRENCTNLPIAVGEGQNQLIVGFTLIVRNSLKLSKIHLGLTGNLLKPNSLLLGFKSHFLFYLADIIPHSTVRTLITELLELFKHLLGSSPLFSRKALILFKPGFQIFLVAFHDRLFPRTPTSLLQVNFSISILPCGSPVTLHSRRNFTDTSTFIIS